MDLKPLAKKYRWRIGLTVLVIVLEALLGILFPLFIGKAIDGILNQNLSGIWQLGILGILLILMGGLRRFYDTRFYAMIYTRLSTTALKLMPKSDSSAKTARLNMLAEMVNFAEDELPAIVQHSLGLIGVMTIIAFLNPLIFYGTLITGILVLSIYFLSGKKTFNYNHQFNNEYDAQVNVVNTNRQSVLRHHLLKLMRWNIKLSDIETINYSISWIIMLLLLMGTIYFSADEGIQYGALFALIMYVYQYIESMVSLPLYYQQWIRLTEITKRLKNI